MRDIHPLTLLALLSDQKFHSGQAIAEKLAISRTTVWKLVASLRKLGLELDSIPGRGYRLIDPPELFNRDAIMEMMGAEVKEQMARLDILAEVDSTNSYLQNHPLLLEERLFSVALAESQTLGRGRRGKKWESPFGRNIYLSLSLSNFSPKHSIEGLSLVTALALVRALSPWEIVGLGIKWPNDLLVQGKKLAGILVEINGEGGGSYRVVIGVGVNVRMSVASGASIDQAWTDLCAHTTKPVSRNQIAANLITELSDALKRFEQGGLEPFLEEWKRCDLTLDREINILQSGKVETGISKGVNRHGALLVETDQGTKQIYSGEVSIRISQTSDTMLVE
ncbi:MAG: bifunctional biotin--[acetyl-CoA-carboxylase] ligase/biotin operon repressor BirA [Gammaproteobacteria bacterium]|nr:bifunctional biotin--[acetyl-CoA-carboxylase] ligase/biotin operon repressor BirA [Gammaproteobacteria bacterium]MDH5694775.1 bifunctional biotin--[acetyl-CoA-carboxylase] ligase/biotin operon repressor BirA [Gammaproteobacteria bacterium]